MFKAQSSKEGIENADETLFEMLDGVVFSELQVAAESHLPAALGLLYEQLQLVGKHRRIAALNDKASISVVDNLRNGSFVGGDAGKPVLHGFEQHQRETLVMVERGQHEYIGTAEISRALVAIDGTMSLHIVAQLQVGYS